MRTYKRRHTVAAFVLGVTVVLIGWFFCTTCTFDAENVLDEPGSAVDDPTVAEIVGHPVRLRIPDIAIDTTFEAPLGIQADQTIEVPDSYETVGYYKYAPKPGEIGPAVVLGHVDSFAGPAVFYRLGQLVEGNEIIIDRDDGSTVTFTVSHLERHSQSGFPTAQVYGDIDHAGLRLITCSGVYNHGTQEYSHNLIVFAKLSTTTPAVGS